MYPCFKANNIHNLTRHLLLRTRDPRPPPGSPGRQPSSRCNIKNKGHYGAHLTNSRNRARCRDLPHHHRGLLDDLGLVMAHTFAMFATNPMHNDRALGDIAERNTMPGRVIIALHSNSVAPTCTRSTLRRSILMSTSTPNWTRLRVPVACNNNLTIPSKPTEFVAPL